MLRNWVRLGGVCLLLLVLTGCRKSMPDLKPPPAPEVLAVPPPEGRFTAGASYPKQAFSDRESSLLRRPDSGVLPARGVGLPGAPGMGRPMGPGAGPGMGGF